MPHYDRRAQACLQSIRLHKQEHGSQLTCLPVCALRIQLRRCVAERDRISHVAFPRDIPLEMQPGGKRVLGKYPKHGKHAIGHCIDRHTQRQDLPQQVDLSP